MITVKYNIDFKKALKELEKEKLSQTLNEGVSDKFAKNSFKFIKSGKVTPKLPKTNPRGTKGKPLFDTGNLANSLKGSSRGITANKPTDNGIPYRSHRESDYTWKGLKVPKREFITAALSSEKSSTNKIYKEFEKKFVKLLSKRIRKR